MNDYEMPLFEWYSIEVELERRRSYIRSAMNANPLVFLLADDELVNEFKGLAELCAIELSSDRTWRQEQDGRHRSHVLEIQYRGDDELWRLFPRSMKHEFPLGEIIKGKLVLTFLGDRKAAERSAQRRLEQIESILDEQRDVIDRFDRSLAQFILDYARQLGRILVANDVH